MKVKVKSRQFAPIVSQLGFSFIELLFVIAIIATISSLGFAAFSRFGNTQTVKIAAGEVSTLLQSAKSQALSQVKPSQCLNQTLEGYQVAISIPSSVYTRDVLCGGKTYTIESKKLPANVSFTANSSLQIGFAVVSGAVSSPGTIILNGYGQVQTITVNKNGTIVVQ